MHGHHTHPGGTDAPKYLVTTTHGDGVICHHTGATWEEVNTFAEEHAEEGDKIDYYAVAPYHLDGVHWQLVA